MRYVFIGPKQQNWTIFCMFYLCRVIWLSCFLLNLIRLCKKKSLEYPQFQHETNISVKNVSNGPYIIGNLMKYLLNENNTKRGKWNTLMHITVIRFIWLLQQKETVAPLHCRAQNDNKKSTFLLASLMCLFM